MKTIIFVFTMGTLLAMNLCFGQKKLEVSGKPVLGWHTGLVYVSSLFFGACGVLIAVFMFGFQQGNKRFIAVNAGILVVQVLFALLLVL